MDSLLEHLDAWLYSGLAAEVLSERARALLELQAARMRQYSTVLEARLWLESRGSWCGWLWDFGTAVLWLKKGCVVRRRSWPEGRILIKQVPSQIEGAVIPGMKSLPASAKSLLLSGANGISYRDQLLVCDYQTGVADSWSPGAEDVFAEDWELLLPGDKKSSDEVAE